MIKRLHLNYVTYSQMDSQLKLRTKFKSDISKVTQSIRGTDETNLRQLLFTLSKNDLFVQESTRLFSVFTNCQ